MDMPDPSPAVLALPSELTIFTVGELHPQWLAWLADATQPGRETAQLEATAVDAVDGAGLQLLLSLKRTLADRGVKVTLTDPSHTLCQACEALGLAETLGLPAVEACT